MRQQTQLDRHYERVRDQGVRILVEDVRTSQDQRVAGQVQDHVRKQRQARQSHQEFGADRGRERAKEAGAHEMTFAA